MTEEDGLSLPKWKGKGQSHNRGAHGELRAPELGKRQMPCRQPDLSYGLGTAADQLRGSEVTQVPLVLPLSSGGDGELWERDAFDGGDRVGGGSKERMRCLTRALQESGSHGIFPSCAEGVKAFW